MLSSVPACSAGPEVRSSPKSHSGAVTPMRVAAPEEGDRRNSLGSSGRGLFGIALEQPLAALLWHPALSYEPGHQIRRSDIESRIGGRAAFGQDLHCFHLAGAGAPAHI